MMKPPPSSLGSAHWISSTSISEGDTLSYRLRYALLLGFLFCLPFDSNAQTEVIRACPAEPTDMTIVYGDAVTCAIDTLGDTDSFRFAASAGDTVAIKAGSVTVLTITNTPCIELFDPQGSKIAGITCDPDGARIDKALTISGTYRVVVSEQSNDTTMGFGVTVLRLAPSPSSTPLEVNLTISEVIDPVGDLDAYSFSAAAGETMLVQVNRSGQGTPCLDLFNPQGINLAAVCNSEGAQVTKTLASAGTYTILVSNGVNGNLNYSVSVVKLTNCVESISPIGRVFAAAGGTGSISVTAPNTCNWSASSNATFLTISSGFSGTGNGVVNYTLSSNTAAATRLGSITVGTRVFKVAQAGTAPLFILSSDEFSFSADSGGRSQSRLLSLYTNSSGLAFNTSVSTTSGSGWLSVSVSGGTMPASFNVTVNPAGLVAGTYQGQVVVTATAANPTTRTLAVTLTVTAPPAASLQVRPSLLRFSFVLGGSLQHQKLTVANLGSGSVAFQVTTSTIDGAPWLVASPSAGTATQTTPATILVSASPSGLAAGTYRGQVSIVSAAINQTVNVPVVMEVNSRQQLMILSNRGMVFTMVESEGVTPPAQSLRIASVGTTALSWSITTRTQSGGNWLLASPSSGSTNISSGNASIANISINPAGLTRGRYYGRLEVASSAADNSPQKVTVVLDILAPGSDPGPLTSPKGFIFSTFAGGPPPAPQVARLSNLTNRPLNFTTGRLTVGGFEVLLPLSGRLPAGQSVDVTLQVPPTAALSAGVRKGTLTINFDDGSVRTDDVVLVITTATAAPAGIRPQSHGCNPATLVPVLTNLGNQFSSVAGWPSIIETKIVDDCSHNITSAVVLASFSNGDAPVFLESQGDGAWAGTWVSQHAATNVEVLVSAVVPGTTLQGSVVAQGAVNQVVGVPIVSSGGVVSSASYAAGIPASPGSFISIFGSQLASSTVAAQPPLPLPNDLAGTRVLLGGVELPLHFVAESQINAIVPYGVSLNANKDLLVVRGSALSVAEPVSIAAAQPAVFTQTQTGTGQGHVYIFVSPTVSALADSSRPAKAGDVITLWCAGLGEVDQSVSAGAAGPSNPVARTADSLKVTIGGTDAVVAFAGLAPGFAGLYQVNATVPSGITPGNAVPVVLTIAGQQGPPVTIAVQ